MKNMNIAQLVLKTKTVEFAHEKYPEFKVKLTYLSKPEQARLQEDSMVTKVDSDSGYPYSEACRETFVKNYATRVVTDWTGLTYGMLAEMLLIDESAIEDLDESVAYSVDNAVTLLTHSKDFEAWVIAKVAKLDNFRSK